jgi:uncharacterized membrane protein YphA (DoxX/SURF4 family)
MTRPSKLVTATRIILGLVFVLSGLNHCLGLVGMPPMSGATARFWQGLAQSHYFLPLLGVCEVVAGALFLSGRWLPLALAITVPITVNVAAFHVVLAREGLPIAALLVAATAFLGWRHRQAFAPLLRAPAASGAGVRLVEIALGLVFVASGLFGLLGAMPPASTSAAAVMLEGMAAARYFIPLLSVVQIAAGALLIARRCTGLALCALAPLVVQILAYRLYVHTPGMLVVGLALVAAEIWLAFTHRALFAGFFSGGTGGQTMPLASVRAVAG